MAREGRVGMGLADRLVIFLAWVVTCGLVYLLGFYVGKGMQERSLGLEERIVRLPVTSQPPPEGQRGRSDNELAFYDKLMGERRGDSAGAPRDPARAAAPAPVSAPAMPSPPAAPAPRPATPAAAPAQRPAVPAAAPSPRPGGPAPTATAAAKPPHAAPVAPAPSTGPPPLPVASPSPPAPPPAADKPPPPLASTPPAALRAGTGGWTVLANPTRSRDDADGLVRQLKGRGYEATLVRVVRDGDTWYRVQIGRFPTNAEATEMMHRLREREGVTHVFVASE